MMHWLTFKRLAYVVVLAIELTVFGACFASAQMYSDADLNAKLARIRGDLVATVEVEIPALFEPLDKVKFKAPKLDLRLRGRSPLDINFDGKSIVIPIATLQFVDDLATLKAWLDKHGCDSKEMLFPNYLHHLPKDARAMDAKGPLAAFGLRRAELLRDPFVDDVSLKYYNSSVWFLIAHEIGHAARGYQSLAGKAAVAQEQEADAFAIKVLRRGRLNPAGVHLYFLATSFNESLSGPRAHPTSAERIRAVALELQKAPGDFVALKSKTPTQDAERVLKIAHDVNRIAALLDDIQARRKKMESDSGASKLESVDSQVFPKRDFTRACPQGRKS